MGKKPTEGKILTKDQPATEAIWKKKKPEEEMVKEKKKLAECE